MSNPTATPSTPATSTPVAPTSIPVSTTPAIPAVEGGPSSTDPTLEIAEAQVAKLNGEEGSAAPGEGSGGTPGLEEAPTEGDAAKGAAAAGSEDLGQYEDLVNPDIPVDTALQANLYKTLGPDADMVIQRISEAVQLEQELGIVPSAAEIVAAADAHAWLRNFAETLEKAPEEAVENLIFETGVDGGAPKLTLDGMRYVEGLAANVPKLPGPAFSKLTAAIASDLLPSITKRVDSVKAYWNNALQAQRTAEADAYAQELLDLESNVNFLSGLINAGKKAAPASSTKDPEVERMRKELDELRRKQEEEQIRAKQAEVGQRETELRSRLGSVWTEITEEAFRGVEALPGIKVAAREALKGAILKELENSMALRVAPHLEAYKKTGTASHLDKAAAQYRTLTKMLVGKHLEKVQMEFGLRKVAASVAASQTATAAATKVAAPAGGASATPASVKDIKREPGESMKAFQDRLAKAIFGR